MTILLLTHSYPDEQVAWRGLFIREQARALAREHEVIVDISRLTIHISDHFQNIHSLKKITVPSRNIH